MKDYAYILKQAKKPLMQSLFSRANIASKVAVTVAFIVHDIKSLATGLWHWLNCRE
jgi:hypothetical protein